VFVAWGIGVARLGRSAGSTSDRVWGWDSPVGREEMLLQAAGLRPGERFLRAYILERQHYSAGGRACCLALPRVGDRVERDHLVLHRQATRRCVSGYGGQ
jgi:hypothetical protein